MSKNNGTLIPHANKIDYDVHGRVGIRLLDPTPGDAEAVARQLGPLQRPLLREPDIIVRFVNHLPISGLRHLTLHENGFTDDGFFVLRSSKKAAKVKIAFDQIGKQCEIVCESGLRAVPLLLAILNLTMLAKDCVALHASGFVYNGTGIVVTGWAKGGKTETLLSFAAHGARYVGDEWILLSGDGQNMYGIPEVIRLWDWHLENLPDVRRQVKRESLLLFKAIHGLDRFQQNLNGRLGKAFPARLLREAMPAIKRQLNVRVDPKIIFGDRFGPFAAKPEKIFLGLSHASPETVVEPIDPGLIAKRMVASIRFEQLPFMEHYLAFKFAFPDRKNEFLEHLPELQYKLLSRALAGKEAYVVRHPYPVSFRDLYASMSPYCERALRPERAIHAA
ncbi:MAG: hypothetical protein ACREOO_11480 [bacterium]